MFKLGIFVLIGGVLNHLRDVITSGDNDFSPFLHNTMDASWTALPMCCFALLLIGHLYKLQKQLFRQATTDMLTGLPNRRCFMQMLAQIYDGDHAIIMLDVDHFKRVNDTYGHDVGDRCLQKTASFLNGQIRPGDLCARWGGEEFAILLRDTSENGARKVGRRLVAGMEYMPDTGRFETITLSAGIAYLDECISPQDALRNADIALYAAKENGRARVEVFDGYANVSAGRYFDKAIHHPVLAV